MKTKVFKFGGGFFEGKWILSFKNFFQNEAESGDRVLFVVSAIKGVTRLLRLVVVNITEKKIGESLKKELVMFFLDEFHKIHSDLISELFNEEETKKILSSDFEELFLELSSCVISFEEKKDDENRFYAKILKFGELASSLIFNSYLHSVGINSILFSASDYIVTNDDYKEGKILKIRSSFKDLFLSSNILSTQGFVGKNQKGQDTVLGFDGSDLSAASFAGELSVDKETEEVYLTFWKDINGFYKEDPSKNPNAEVSNSMTYLEYSNLLTRPIRLDAVKYALEKGINVNMRCFLDPSGVESKIHK